MNKRMMIVLFAVFAAILFSLPQHSSAAPEISIDVEAGFQNKVKYDRGFPVQIKVTNSGSAFSGDLVLGYSESYNMGAGLTIPLDIGGGESKTFQIALPGMMDTSYMGNTSSQTIFLYEGGWEDGDSIDFEGPESLQPTFYGPSSLFVATLTGNPDRLVKIGQVSPAGSDSTQLFHLNQIEDLELPTEAEAWGTIDYLIIDEFAYSDLPAAVQDAIHQWLQQGGQILLGTTNNTNASMGNLSEFLPLEISGSQEISVPLLENPVPGFKTELKEGAIALVENEGQIAAARQNVGAGAIIQTSFSLGDETATAQDGYGEFITNFVSLNTNTSGAYQGQSTKETISNEIGNSNELFESFAVSKTLIFVIILLYIILIVPVLYTILKKKDKRELAWIIIPAAAIITSIGLFAAGAKDRIANSQIQQTGFFEVDEDNGLNGYYMNSLLSNRGGDFQFTAPDSTTMTLKANSQFSEGSPHMSAILEKQAAANSLTIRDMRYWSVSSIIGESYIENSGEFDIQLELESKILSGTIQNNFPFAVEDLAIWTGTRLLSLGDLNPGEILTVNQTAQGNTLPAISPIVQSYGNQPIGDKEELMEARKQAALAISFNSLSQKGSSPYLIAYTNDAIVPVTLENQRAEVSSVHLIAQSFEPASELSGDAELEGVVAP